MKENVFENPVEMRSTVRTPHFDDHRVVQRAQPVVPLQEIRSKLKARRLLYLGGAFAVAILLGAAMGLMSAHFKRSQPAPQLSQVAVTNDETPETVTSDTATTTAAEQLEVIQPETTATAESPLLEAAAPETVAQPVKPIIAPKKQEAPWEQRSRVVGRKDAELSRESRGVQPSDEEQLEQMREAALYDEWQERRQRRAERRERRRHRNGRDLSRVDELFEGRRRPERP